MTQTLKSFLLAGAAGFLMGGLGACQSSAETALAAATPAETPASKAETPITFTTANGETTEAFEGTFQVPENRANPNSRMLTIHYVRFPTTSDTPGAPIVYLSGGPGGSGIGTARGPRFALFMAMRQHGDVIAYDQRGTGASNDMETCERPTPPSDVVTSDAEALAGSIAALTECLTEWEEAGIDLDGYDTVENARDLEALRQHLGADKLSLWGISYGSHLGLTALRELDGRIDRAVFASIEGLDQTVKLPARADEYLDRLDAALKAADPKSPDLKPLIDRVHARAEADPFRLTVDGAPVRVMRRDLQGLMSGMTSDPKWARMLIGIYADLDKGDVTSLTQLYSRFGIQTDYNFRPMNALTDIASGTDPDRRALIAEQAKTARVGSALNAPYVYEDIRPDLILPPSFREPVQSDVPVLMLSGTLDGRTYPESARETMVGLPNAQQVLIEGAGHNLFMTSPKVGSLIHDFMRGETDLPRQITVPIPD